MQLIPDRTLIQFIIMRWLFQMIRLLNMSKNSPFDVKKTLETNHGTRPTGDGLKNNGPSFHEF